LNSKNRRRPARARSGAFVRPEIPTEITVPIHVGVFVRDWLRRKDILEDYIHCFGGRRHLILSARVKAGECSGYIINTSGNIRGGLIFHRGNSLLREQTKNLDTPIRARTVYRFAILI